MSRFVWLCSSLFIGYISTLAAVTAGSEMFGGTKIDTRAIGGALPTIDIFHPPWYIIYGGRAIFSIWATLILIYVILQIRYYLKFDTIFTWKGLGKNISIVILMMLGCVLTNAVFLMILSSLAWGSSL